MQAHDSTSWGGETVGIVAVGAAAVVALVGVAALLHPEVVLDLLRDPLRAAGVADDRPWLGALSNVGVLLWTVAGAAAATAGLVLRRDHAEGRFLLSVGLFGLALAADDLLLVHDYLVPAALDSDRSQYLVLGAEAAVAGAIGWRWRARLKGEIGSLGLICACLGLSLAVDALVGGEEGGARVVEDLAKLAGIAGFAALSVHWAVAALQEAISREHARTH